MDFVLFYIIKKIAFRPFLMNSDYLYLDKFAFEFVDTVLLLAVSMALESKVENVFKCESDEIDEKEQNEKCVDKCIDCLECSEVFC